METSAQTIQERLGVLATSDLGEFRQFMRRLRKLFPEQAAEACLLYIANHGLNEASQSMAFWLSGDHVYLSVLLDPAGLPQEIAPKTVPVLKVIDFDFLHKFMKAVTDLKDTPRIMRALSLLPAIGDYSILIPWLRRLAQSPELKIRSRASKLLCELRPNKGMIEKQMHSDDARIRANAVEAMWHSNTPEARQIFEAALNDTHHRVVGNGLVGLYGLGDTGVLNRMVELCAHEDHLFRAAMAWAMGFVKDSRAIPTLQELTHDPSLVVRKRALNSLLLLECLKPEQIETLDEKPAALPTPAGENPATPPPLEEMPFNLFMFK